MKCLQILCTLIIFWFGAIHAEADWHLYAKCSQQSHVISEREKSCIEENFLTYNNTVIENDFQRVITQYSGDNSEFQTLVNKYCPIVGQVQDCKLISFDIDDDCLIDQRYKLEDQQQYKLAKALLNYMCADSGAAALPLLQNDAFQFILENDEFEECMSLLYGDSIDLSSHTGPKFVTCDGIDKAFKCVPDRVNSNLLTFANDVRLVFRQAVECGPENEL